MRMTAIGSRNVDVLVIGGGIAAMQSALDLAQQGYPTLDCASCITTPKMSAAAHHPNIAILPNTEVEEIRSDESGHVIRLMCKPTYVNADKCIGCRLCEYACDTEYADPFENGLGAVRAIAVPFTNAIPQKAVLDAEHCGTCGACLRVCPTDAIEFDQVAKSLIVHADAVIIASGYQLNSMNLKPQ